MNTNEVLKLALEALENGVDGQTSIEMDEAINLLREELAEQPPVQQDRVQANWRKLALKFDAQRMSALAHLRMMVQDPSKHMEVAREFLAAAPQPAQQEPVAWVDVKDTHYGPYEFHGKELLPVGKHDLYTSPQPAQHEPVAWEGKTKLGLPTGAHRLIFSDRVRADEWMSGFVDGHAWLEPLTYTSPPAQRTRVMPLRGGG